MRQRNYKVPPRKARESWVAYHDRLSRLIRQASRAGATGASKALQRAAGKVAAKHKSVRDPRKKRGKLTGPGTYPWEQCVKDQKRRGARDPKAVCGRIRASSRKRYPLYWAERGKGARPRKNPSTCEFSELAYENMDTATDQIAHAFTLKNPADRLEQAMSAAMYAGAALANASGSDDRGLRTQAKSIAQQVRDAAKDLIRPTKNPAKAKKTEAATKNPGRAAAIMRSFERL